MYRLSLLMLFFTFFTGPLFAQTDADLDKVRTEDAIIATLYDVISGPAGEARDWDLMRYLFHEDARLMAMGRDQEGEPRFMPMTVDEYIERNGPYLEESGFFEGELSRKTDRFGKIVQIFSTYDSRRTAQGPVFQRGINSIQLIQKDGRYYIVNILWNSENEDTPIPKRYLRKRKK